MKKFNLFFVLTLISSLFISCSSEMEENDGQSELITDYINYSFKGENITISFTEDQEGEMVPVRNDALNRLETFFEEYPELAQYVLDDNTIELFVDNKELDEYLKLKEENAQKTVQRSDPYSHYISPNMILYENCCYDSRTQFSWGDICVFGNSSFVGYNNYNRLKDFTKTIEWWTPLNPQTCNPPKRVITYPNDKLSSIKVFNVAARLYEHPNYSGKSLFIEGRARFGKPYGGGVKRLKKVSFGFLSNWSDKTSSIILYE